MKKIDLALNALILLTATVFLAYVGFYYFDFGLFKTLPSSITGFFLGVGALQYVALALFVAALVGKVATARAMKRQDAQNQM